MEKRLCPGVSLRHGRPGMSLWRIFVLGVVKQANPYNFEKLTDEANNHDALRQMRGHASFLGRKRYKVQTIMDHVRLLTDGILDEINAAVVACGHRWARTRKSDGTVRCWADSVVAKTHVHGPTDVSLLWDAMRCLVRVTARFCKDHNIAGWRKHRYWLKKLKRCFAAVSTRQRRRNVEKVKHDLRLCVRVVNKVRKSVKAPVARAIPHGLILHFLRHAARQINQVERRRIKKEKIPHGEKVFSIFEAHTRWIGKGKAGTLAELGVPVCAGRSTPVHSGSSHFVGRRGSGQGCTLYGQDEATVSGVGAVQL